MKKLFSVLFVAAVAMTMGTMQSCTSCEDVKGGATSTFVYNVTVQGEANGDVEVIFPNGNFEMNGIADLDFAYSNDTTLMAVKATPLSEALVSNDIMTATFASTVDSMFDIILKDAEAGGHCKATIKGYVKESITGIIIRINKEFEYPKPVWEVADSIQ